MGKKEVEKLLKQQQSIKSFLPVQPKDLVRDLVKETGYKSTRVALAKIENKEVRHWRGNEGCRDTR